MNKINKNNLIQTTLGELVSKEKKSIISGPFGSNVGKKFFKETGIPLIRGNNLSTGEKKFKDEGFVFLTQEKADELNCYAIKNDLIFTAVGTIGQVGIIDEKLKFKEYVISNKQLRVRFDNSKITPLFAYYWFSSYWIQKLIRQRNVGSTVPLINLSVLKGLPITFPKSINVQNNIVDILENISQKIELNNKINRELEAMAKLLYDYWFVQFDFPDENGKSYKSSGGKMVFNEELKREIPEGWEVKKLSTCCKIVDCLHSKKSNYIFENENKYLLQLENIKEDGLLDLSKKYYVSNSEYKRWTTRIEVQDNDLVITNAGRVAGLAQIPKNVKAGIGRNITAIRPTKVEPTFLYYTFQGAEMERQIKLNTDTGSFFKSLNVRGIKELFVIRPPKPLENEFERINLKNRRMRELNSEQNQKLTELRDWILPMLMNGQVRVGEIESELGMAAEDGERYIKKVVNIERKCTNIQKVILAGHILNKNNTEDFGRVKFQKLLFLTEYICEIDLNSNYVQKAAGPHDDFLIRNIELDLKKHQFFDIRKSNDKKNKVTYTSTNSAKSLETEFLINFKNEAKKVDALLEKLNKFSWNDCEIIATLFAVWNNRIIKDQPISNDLLKQDFLDWDKQKIKYKNRLEGALSWMKNNDVVPYGWGKYIDKA
ncbi:MAG: restriction endonuclease subunit S [Lutibacter sp.]|jgi:type I restriction enzyme S subunit